MTYGHLSGYYGPPPLRCPCCGKAELSAPVKIRAGLRAFCPNGWASLAHLRSGVKAATLPLDTASQARSEKWCAIEAKKMVMSFCPQKAAISALNRLGITSALIERTSGCVRGFPCPCAWLDSCYVCHKCPSHCACPGGPERDLQRAQKKWLEREKEDEDGKDPDIVSS